VQAVELLAEHRALAMDVRPAVLYPLAIALLTARTQSSDERLHAEDERMRKAAALVRQEIQACALQAGATWRWLAGWLVE
jgi:hypothetical protein